jgi:hypothetical protein
MLALLPCVLTVVHRVRAAAEEATIGRGGRSGACDLANPDVGGQLRPREGAEQIGPDPHLSGWVHLSGEGVLASQAVLAARRVTASLWAMIPGTCIGQDSPATGLRRACGVLAAGFRG